MDFRCRDDEECPDHADWSLRTDSPTDRQIDRETDRQRDKERDRHTARERERERERETDPHASDLGFGVQGLGLSVSGDRFGLGPEDE